MLQDVASVVTIVYLSFFLVLALQAVLLATRVGLGAQALQVDQVHPLAQVVHQAILQTTTLPKSNGRKSEYISREFCYTVTEHK